jgi:putative oxidoreductase
MLSDLGILLIRMLLGMAMSVHGAQKLLGWFGGYGLNGTASFLEELGFRPGVGFAAAIGLSELAGGVLLMFGLFTPFGAAAVLVSMLLAIASIQFKNRFLVIATELELPFIYAVSAVGIAFTGAGAFSLDAILGYKCFGQPFVVEGALILALIATAAAARLRR